MAFIWANSAGSLGNITHLSAYNNQLQVSITDTSRGTLGTFSIAAGSLPAGLLFSTTTGNATSRAFNIYGIPSSVSSNTTSRFTVRSSLDSNATIISDRTFSITVVPTTANIVLSPSTFISDAVAGTLVTTQFSVTGSQPATYTVSNGSLPNGVTLTSAGLLSGHLATDIDSSTNTYFASNTYTFSITANNGISSVTNTYTTNVTTANSVPTITTLTGNVGTFRQGHNIAVKIDGTNYLSTNLANADQGFTYRFTPINSDWPSGLTFDGTTGWLTGSVPVGYTKTADYLFDVGTQLTSNTSVVGDTVNYSLTIIGPLSGSVGWLTSSNLGVINNGSVSDLAVVANANNKSLTYSLVRSKVNSRDIDLSLFDVGLVGFDLYPFDPSLTLSGNTTAVNYGTLPPGLALQSDGTITGRPSFNYAADTSYTFVVAVQDAAQSVYDEREFTVTIASHDTAPYENLYIQLMAGLEQREIFDLFINDETVFASNLIYRPNDPWFGINTKRRSLMVAGLKPKEASAYAAAMATNHYKKAIRFGDIKTARALDNNFNSIYEVVYVELVDEGVNASGVGPAQSFEWPARPNSTANLTVSGNVVYTNSFTNMVKQTSSVGYENRSVLPAWMTSVQESGSVLGFTKALVLCYCKPGTSKQIALNAAQKAAALKNIDFTIDRYHWDNSLSTNYIKSSYGNVNAQHWNTRIIKGAGNLTVSGTVITTAANISTSVGNIIAINNSSSITGIGTRFARDTILGSGLYYAANIADPTSLTLIGNVAKITSNTNITLDVNATSNINTTFTVYKPSADFEYDLHVGDGIYIADVLVGNVTGITSKTQATIDTSAGNVANVAYTIGTLDSYAVPGEGDKYLVFPKTGILN